MSLTKLQDAPVARNVFVATPAAGTRIEDMLKPEYWAHVSRMLHVSDRIEAVPEDGEFFAEFFVCDAGLNRASVVLLRKHNLQGEQLPVVASDYEVKWKGQSIKHVVYRISDKAVVKDNFQSKTEAELWLREYELGLHK